MKNERFRKLVKRDIGHHYFIEIYLDGRWIRIDTTFDSALRPKLPVNKWDGKNDTPITSKPEKFFNQKESEELFRRESTRRFFETRIRQNGKLYKALNEEQDRIRQGKELRD